PPRHRRARDEPGAGRRLERSRRGGRARRLAAGSHARARPPQAGMKQDTIARRFELFLRARSLKLTTQRRRILDRAFATHEHFSAERLWEWMRDEPGPRVSRATVYRTLSLLAEGRFVEALDTGKGELLYEHVLGHPHHDHMLCVDCGRIEEFHDERIEELQ